MASHIYYKSIDVMISLLTILVVLGHNYVPWRPGWYDGLHKWIYSFHMGAFFFVCGFLVANAYKPVHSVREYGRYVMKRLMKFGVPFCILGSGMLAIYAVRNGLSWTGYLHEIKLFLLDPSGSHVIFLWFLYVLLGYYMLTPLLLACRRRFIFFELLAALGLYLFPLPRILCGHLLSRYLIFFLGGIIVQQNLEVIKRLPVWLAWAAWPVFLYFSVFRCGEMPYLLTGALAVPCLYSLASTLEKIRSLERLFHAISRNCYVIYLFQMLFLNLLALVFRWAAHTSVWFVIYLMAGEVGAIGGSLILGRGYNAYTDFISRKGSKCA